MIPKNQQAQVGDIVCKRGKPSIMGYVMYIYEKAPSTLYSPTTIKLHIYWIKTDTASLHQRHEVDIVGKANPEQKKQWGKAIDSRPWDKQESEFEILLHELYPFNRE